MNWEWILFIGIIFTAIVIITIIILSSNSNNSSGQRPPVVDNNSPGTGGEGEGGDTGSGEGEGGDTGSGGEPGDTSGDQNGTNDDPIPPVPGDYGTSCTTNSNCVKNNCSKGYCQPSGTITGYVSSVCSSSGPSCNTGLLCLPGVNGLGTCVPTTGKYGSSCDDINKRCNSPYVCTLGTCQFNVPTSACIGLTCSSGFTCVNNVCKAPSSQFCTTNDNCLTAACSNTIYGNRFVIDSTNTNYLSWVTSLNPIPALLTPAFISQLEVTSDRTEAWMYIGTNTVSTKDPNNSLRAIQYWNASSDAWILAQSWRYDNFYTYPDGTILSGILRGITLAPSNKCYALFDVISSTVSGVNGLAIFQIVPVVSNLNVSFSLVPYNSISIPGLQRSSTKYEFSNVTAISSTTYNDSDYMIIYATGYIPNVAGTVKTPYVRDINNLSSPYYISTGLNLVPSSPNIFPTYYFAPSSTNPLLDFTTVNYGDLNNIVSLTYTGTINRTVLAPSINNTVNQFVTYRHCQMNGKAALAMIYSSIVSPSIPVVSTLAINYDVATSDNVESFPGYITSNPVPPLAANVDALYVINSSICN